MSSKLLFIGAIIAADCFIDKITPYLKVNNRLTSSQYVALNHVIKKVKPQCKLSYKLLKEENVHDPLLDISPYPTLIQLKYFLGGIHHCVTVVGKWVFYSNFTFVLSITKDNFHYCCINDNYIKVMNVFKGVLKAMRFLTAKWVLFSSILLRLLVPL